MHVWLDGDILVFRAGFAAEKTAYYLKSIAGEPKRFQYKKEADQYIQEHGLNPALLESYREVEPLPNALHTVKLMLYSLQEALQVTKDEITICLSGSDNFRYHVAKTKPYKGNRDAAHRPTHEKAIKDYLINQYTTVISDGEEADDYIGRQHYAMWVQDPESTCIATLDKDLNMIPGLHYNFSTNKSYVIDEKQANYIFWKQLLTGDPTDNIPGIPKMGPVTAERVLANVDEEDYAQVVANEYKKAYGDGWEEKMTEMGRLIWIRRREDEWWSVEGLCLEGLC